MRAQLAELFTLGIDSVAEPTDAILADPKFKFVVGYLGNVTPKTLAKILLAGKAFMPVTFGGWRPANLSATQTVHYLLSLSLPPQVTVWLDLEAQPDPAPAPLIAAINHWAGDIIAAGFVPGLYVGAGHQLTSEELQHLAVVRYWQGCSHLLDRDGRVAEPAVGWCMHQLYPPNAQIDEEKVDVDVIRADFKGRVPRWVVSP